MAFEIIGTCGTKYTDREGQTKFELRLAIEFLKNVCGLEPKGSSLITQYNYSFTSTNFYCIALNFENMEMNEEQNDYLSLCKEALLTLDDCIDWKGIWGIKEDITCKRDDIRIAKAVFPLKKSDSEWVSELVSFACRLVDSPEVDLDTKDALQKAIKLLENLPKAPSGMDLTFDITQRGGDENSSEMRYWSMSLSSTTFSVSSGGSIYDRSVGSDSFTIFDFLCEVEGHRSMEGDIWQWLAETNEVLNFDDTIIEAKIDCEEVTVED